MKLELFNFEETPVRVVVKDGSPWWIAADVCRVLEIVNSSHAISRLDPDEKGVANSDTLGGNQKVSIVSESGLYALIFKSRKETARRFRKWVTAEVLPTLRRTGRFAVDREEVSLFDWIESHRVPLKEALRFGRMARTAAREMGFQPRATEMTGSWKSFDSAFLDWLWSQRDEFPLPLPTASRCSHETDRSALWREWARQGQILTNFDQIIQTCRELALFREWVPDHYAPLSPAQRSGFGLWLSHQDGYAEAGIRMRLRGHNRQRQFVLERSLT
ncbi:MAG: hypothetical protein B9S32_13790 [Verrucomicrobia bacterium Tous-C9LFEB]|nr:MAG: hypothetical protein B9S32_13790 [Verrucomicrobia bacterium Tous-C9LFEB]